VAKVQPDSASLDAFADSLPARQNGPVCWACALKERAWVEKARRDGRTISTIRATLIKVCGYPPEQVTKNKLAHHFSNHMGTT
jgi:hypothetical protein